MIVLKKNRWIVAGVITAAIIPFCFLHAHNHYSEAVHHAIYTWSDLEVVAELLKKEVNFLDNRLNNDAIMTTLCSALGRLVMLNQLMRRISETEEGALLQNDTDFWIHVLEKINSYLSMIKEHSSLLCVTAIEKEFLLFNSAIEKMK